ncbi:MAG: helix-turn-helix domain-containing protein [Sulfuritalea sp.]|nr:helix-turn-helix domain-containing protein [Sulfuritalea sp.]
MTQKEFAEATGVHFSSIRKYENRNSEPSAETLLAISSTGVNLHWLVTGEGDMRASVNRPDSADQSEADAAIFRRLLALEGLLHGMKDDKRSAVMDEIFSRVQETKRLAELEDFVGNLERKRG